MLYAVAGGWWLKRDVSVLSHLTGLVVVFVPDLLAYELCRTGVILPLAQEQLAQERVQGLLLIAVLLASAGILLLEGGQEPLQHQDGALLGVGFLGGRDEDGWVLAPVGAELGEGGARQDERRRGQAGEVAVEGSDRLRAGGGGKKEAVLVLVYLAGGLAQGQPQLTFKNAVQLLPAAWGF